MDNRTIEEVRENETKLIDEIKQSEWENQLLRNQQKEFIEWLEDKEKQFDIMGDPINSGACLGILRKYKEIIGGLDE